MEKLGFPLETVVLLLVVVGVSVFVDLFLHRNKTEVTIKDATVWSVFWVVLAIGFYFYLDFRFGAEYASMFMAGYALEKSLSIDNMMVFVAIFASFGIKGINQHRILYYGIVGALIFRAIFVAAGTSIFSMASWVELVFALIVAWTAVMMFKGGDDEDEQEDYSDHWSVKFTKRLFPVFPRLAGNKFFISKQEAEKIRAEDSTLSLAQKGTMYATPMFLCLMCIEVSDIIFSFDSVPAIIAVTQEPLLVYAATIFAILGLRNLYFMLAAAAKYLCHLEKAVALILAFIAIKLGASAVEKTFGIPTFHVPHDVSLYVVISLIAFGVIASVAMPEKQDEN